MCDVQAQQEPVLKRLSLKTACKVSARSQQKNMFLVGLRSPQLHQMLFALRRGIGEKGTNIGKWEFGGMKESRGNKRKDTGKEKAAQTRWCPSPDQVHLFKHFD